MDEHEFDSLLQSRPYGTQDAHRVDASLRRCATLGIALWGKTLDDLQRQLLAPHPEIPVGFTLTDFQELQRTAERLSAVDPFNPRVAWLQRWARTHGLFSPTISVSGQRYTYWEARCEVLRRAIEFLEKRR